MKPEMRRSSPHDSRPRGGLSTVSLTLVLALGACRGSETPATTAATVELLPMDAEVWLSPLHVHGVIAGAFDPVRCDVENGSTRSAARLKGHGFELELTLAPGENRVSVRCSDAGGRRISSARVVYTLRVLSDAAPRPLSPRNTSNDAAWLDDAVIYGLVPPLYGKPPLVAARAALPRLADLGVRAIWLSPVFATLPGDFGYAVTDYFRVREDFGTEDDLRAFIERAHALGLKVLLDFVPNHTSVRHPYFVQAEAFGTRSHYYAFYQRDASGRIQHYFDWAHLPNLDYDNAEVRVWITSAARHWVRDFGVDGYRVDAAWGVSRRAPDFYDDWSRQLHQERSLVLIAEASARDPFYLQHGFDAAYDWTSELGEWAWSAVFASGEQIAPRLEQAVRATEAAGARSDRVLRFLNNNDTGQRFVTKHGMGLTRVATAALFTLPGIPSLYSFDEEGGEFEPYAGLRPLSIVHHPELLELHRHLIALRHGQRALRSAEIRFLATGTPDVSVYWRAGAPALLVALNWSARPQTLHLDLPTELSKTLTPLSGEATAAQRGQSLRLILPAYGYGVMAAGQ